MANLQERFKFIAEVQYSRFAGFRNWKRFFQRFTRKGFRVELDEKHSLPFAQDFAMANLADMMHAIDRYCEKNHHQVAYLSTDPLTFRLDDKEAYQAELMMEHGRCGSAYCIHCQQLPE